MLERLFGLAAHGTTARRELLGGVTTFATMAYIIVVNPAILSFAGVPAGPGTVATILTAAFGSLLMGFYANQPIAVAPYMGENAFVAFGLAAIGATWPQMLGAVFVSGLVFLAVTLLGLRAWLAEAISTSLKHAFAVGIGLFLALIGLYQTGIVTSGASGLPPAALTGPGGLLRAPDVPLKVGALRDPRVLLAVAGFLLMAVLLQRGVRGALLIGIAATALAGALLGYGEAPRAVAALPFAGELSLQPLLLKLDVAGVLRLAFVPALLTLVVMGLLDTLGTLVGLGAAAGLLDEEGRFPRIERPMTVDALSCAFAGLVGTTTSGAYIESATGIREGARTGLAAATTGALFLLSLFFVPLVAPLQRLQYAYAPALVAVGLLMAASARRIDFDDLTEAVPAFATIAMMVFTYNIGNGLTAGLLLYPLVKTAAGRWRQVHGGAWVLAAISAVYFAFGLPH
ncbi:MAG TPA: NCS2 family permease [Vicinamibacteria bacterium]|nr:NCS2 family permease [Vicinamibacteria bacterium]